MPAMIENRTFDEIAIGETASMARTLTQQDIELFAIVSGDLDPTNLDPVYAGGDLSHQIIAPGMWGGTLIAAVLNTRLPGPGTIYVSQDLHFHAVVSVGDTITTRVTVLYKKPERQNVVFDCRCVNQTGWDVITGRAEVKAPTDKVRRATVDLPVVRVSRHPPLQAVLAPAHEPASGRRPLPKQR
jgi:acyl dehydratase